MSTVETLLFPFRKSDHRPFVLRSCSMDCLMVFIWVSASCSESLEPRIQRSCLTAWSWRPFRTSHRGLSGIDQQKTRTKQVKANIEASGICQDESPSYLEVASVTKEQISDPNICARTYTTTIAPRSAVGLISARNMGAKKLSHPTNSCTTVRPARAAQ